MPEKIQIGTRISVHLQRNLRRLTFSRRIDAVLQRLARQAFGGVQSTAVENRLEDFSASAAVFAL